MKAGAYGYLRGSYEDNFAPPPPPAAKRARSGSPAESEAAPPPAQAPPAKKPKLVGVAGVMLLLQTVEGPPPAPVPRTASGAAPALDTPQAVHRWRMAEVEEYLKLPQVCCIAYCHMHI